MKLCELIHEGNDLDACIYCKHQRPKNRAQAKRLKDTRANRAREDATYKALTAGHAKRQQAKKLDEIIDVDFQVKHGLNTDLHSIAAEMLKHCDDAYGRLPDNLTLAATQVRDELAGDKLSHDSVAELIRALDKVEHGKKPRHIEQSVATARDALGIE